MSMETGGQPKMKEKLIKKKSQLEGMEDEETAFKQTNAPVKTTDALIKRGDVVWVRWRRSPLWPALVHNVQPKKMTYVFFPLPKNDNGKKPQLFSCNPNSVYRVSVTEKTPFGASKDLVEALKEAKLRIFKDGKVEGSAAILRPESKPMTEKEIKRAFPLLRIETRNEKDTGKQNKEDSDGDDGNAEDKEKRKGVIESEEPAKKRAREDLSIPAKEESSRAAEAFVQKLQENYKPILEQLYAEEIVSFSNVPDRRDIRISMASACFLSDDNADILYENIVDFVREKNQKNRLSLLALHFVAQSLFPEVIARCLMIHRRISYEKAKRVVHPPEF